MSAANRAVALIVQSPFHRLLSTNLLPFRRTWRQMTGQAHHHSRDPKTVDDALEAFGQKFPRYRTQPREADPVVVICRPLSAKAAGPSLRTMAVEPRRHH